MREDDKMDPEVFRRVGFTRMVTHGLLLWEYSADDDRHYLVGVVDQCGTAGEEADDEADKFYETGKLYQPVVELRHERPKSE